MALVSSAPFRAALCPDPARTLTQEAVPQKLALGDGPQSRKSLPGKEAEGREWSPHLLGCRPALADPCRVEDPRQA